MERDVWQHYQQTRPGQVQVLGPDLWDGSNDQLINFKNTIGATFPLLPRSGNAAGTTNENLFIPYGDWDNYVVINKQGIIRYHAADLHMHGGRFFLGEVLTTIDSLVSAPVGVDEGLGPRALALTATPNPFGERTTLALTNSLDRPVGATITVHDLAGRAIATLWDRPAPRGVTRVTWDGRAADGSPAAPGVYVVRARIGETWLQRRVVRLR